MNAAGNIQSHQTADLSFGQSGTVKKINVTVGLHVQAGEVLARIPVGPSPHGVLVWPQPGRYSLGHVGILR